MKFGLILCSFSCGKHGVGRTRSVRPTPCTSDTKTKVSKFAVHNFQCTVLLTCVKFVLLIYSSALAEKDSETCLTSSRSRSPQVKHRNMKKYYLKVVYVNNIDV